MATISGKNGAVSSAGTELQSVTDWKVSYDASNARGVASGTSGGTITTAGVKDWKGSFGAYGKNPPLVPGASSAFIGDTGASKASGTIFMASASLAIDYDQGAYLKWDCAFEGSGALTLASTTSEVDAGAPLFFTALGGKVRWQPIVSGTLGTLADLPTCKDANFGMTCQIEAYTEKGVSVRSKLAANPDFSASCTILDAALGAVSAAGTNYEPGTQGVLHIYVNATEYFSMSYMTVKSVEPYCDIETGAIVGQTVNFEWSAYAVISATQTKGSIIAPSTTVLWGS